VAAAVVALDQATKWWAVRALADGPVEVVGSNVRLALTRNRGGAFSLFSGSGTTVAVLAAVLVVILVRMARHEDDAVTGVALAVLLGGALGNLTDRLVREPGPLRGAVVDFVDLGAWPTFNVADIAVTVGAALLLLWGWREHRPERPIPE
jgi:signal peptidase II